MPSPRAAVVLLSCLVPVFTASSFAQATPDSLTLFDFGRANSGGKVEMTPDVEQGAGFLTLSSAPNQSAVLNLQPTGGHWNIDPWTRVEVEVHNPGKAIIRFAVRVQNEGGNDWSYSADNTGFLAPKERKIFNVFFWRTEADRDRFPELKPFKGMNGLPGGFQTHWHTIDATDVRSIQIQLFGGAQAQRLEIFRVSATHPVVSAVLREKGVAFFPFIDQFGQYKYGDWPGKVKNEAQLQRDALLEAKDLKEHPGPPGWDKYGGWLSGPSLNATGHFRTQKVEGKWWLVDPDGYLFWSHGPNSVGTGSAATPYTGRENFFDALPPGGASGPQTNQNANFLQWNMARQYGADWKKINLDLTHRRLRSWGMNTIGNWSEGDIESLDRTPYTESLWPWSPTMGGDTMWDVFNPDFAKNFESGIQNGVQKTSNDPWCIGYFVHNEMGWAGNALGYTSQILATPPETFTKREFIRDLRAKIPEIADFNAETGRHFADWDALLANRESFDLTGIRPDAEAFYSRYAEKYFQTCAEGLHKFAPNQLYLGARMNVSNPLSIAAAAKWCDVLSFNLYQDDISGFRPADSDKPVIASEFHFGALDRGMFATGLRGASDQEDRAKKYSFYVEGAARNPYLVGAHWFAYCPQAVTGRGDGENYEDGLFDITNNPYPELRDALRKTGYALYKIRLAK